MATKKIEAQTGVDQARATLADYAWGEVLETCIGTGMNDDHLMKNPKVTFVMGIDWVQSAIEARSQYANSWVAVMDACKMAFHDESFDTVLDTFGLECSYNLES